MGVPTTETVAKAEECPFCGGIYAPLCDCPALPPDGIPEPSLRMLRVIHSRLVTSGSEAASMLAWAIQEIEDNDASFEVRHGADMRAIDRWRLAHPGNELRQPDHADLCVWLMSQIEQPHEPGGSLWYAHADDGRVFIVGGSDEADARQRWHTAAIHSGTEGQPIYAGTDLRRLGQGTFRGVITFNASPSTKREGGHG
jgi:hypothetical protein